MTRASHATRLVSIPLLHRLASSTPTASLVEKTMLNGGVLALRFNNEKKVRQDAHPNKTCCC